MKMCVTGGAGFIGSNLVDRLLKDGHEVVVIDDLSSGKTENLPENRNLKFIKKSICDNISKDVDGCTAVFHLAANPQVQYSIQNPIETNNVNLGGTLNVLDACVKKGVKRFVFSSSCSVYGDQDRLPYIETMKPNPLSPYALHKLTGEHYCRLFRIIHNMETVSLRYFNVYGPRQNPAGNYACLVPKVITLFHSGKPPLINGDGNQTRDFIFVEDVVEANILAATTRNAAAFGEIFNVGEGIHRSVNEVVSTIKRISGSSIEPIHGPPVIEPRNALADVTKSAKILGWKPRMSFEEGLKKTHEYFTR